MNRLKSKYLKLKLDELCLNDVHLQILVYIDFETHKKKWKYIMHQLQQATIAIYGDLCNYAHLDWMRIVNRKCPLNKYQPGVVQVLLKHKMYKIDWVLDHNVFVLKSNRQYYTHNSIYLDRTHSTKGLLPNIAAFVANERLNQGKELREILKDFQNILKL